MTFAFLSLFSSSRLAIQDEDKKSKAEGEKKSRALRQLYLIGVSKLHCDAINLESAWSWN